MINRNSETSATVGLAPIGTAVVWVGCLVVGITGTLMPFMPRAAPTKNLSPVQATLIHVELTKNSSPPPSPAAAAEPALTAALEPPPPPIAAVAAPTAAVAFALPTSGPTQTTSAINAVPTRATNQEAPAVQRLTYGQGEGEQPAPEYPLEADIAGQRGSILVRFTIGEDGRVTSAEAIQPCLYPLLNQSAVRTIREEWRFKPGPVRVDEIIIEFKRKHE
jgi:protein TonB